MGILDPAPSTKDSEVADIWLLASKELIGCFAQKLVDVNTVDDVTCSINCFRPEALRCLVFIKHSVGHLNKSPILALHDAILLRSIRRR